MADYHEMWKNLGMNVELHDQLCEALPQAFGDVYLTQENRPQAMDYFNFVVSEIHGYRPAELIEHQKKVVKYSVLSVFMSLMKSFSQQTLLLPAYAAAHNSGFQAVKRFYLPTLVL